MGCSSSKSSTSNAAGAMRPLSIRKSNPLTDREIRARIESPAQSQTVTLGGIRFKYAWVSQRGYYPDALDKDNQDAFAVLQSFGRENQAFFGIFDGHGKEGHLCARYIRDNLPKCILNKLGQIKSSDEESIKQALTSAHLSTNDALHLDNSIDDSLAGTTSISIVFQGRKMYISNVGDSRAIIGSVQNDSKIVSQALSSDHTPYRKDERERVKKHGARILSMDQLEGIEPVHENWGDLTLGDSIDEGGDPPRVWSPHGDYPGTAFTRSFGDMYAEELGVTAEPEIVVRDIAAKDKMVIIASDGVFEFLTNQMVINMAAQFSDPLEACHAIVSSAYNLWLQYEVRTDDISIIILYVDDVQDGPNDVNIETRSESGSISRDERPVRRAMSRDKKKTIIMSYVEEKYDESDMSKIIMKSDIEVQSINEAIRNNFLFQHLNEIQLQQVISFMEKVEVKAGDWVIKQGDRGDKFYIIDEGTFEVRVASSDKVDPKGGPVVHVYQAVSGVGQHPSFGELALMYGKPRAASVIANSNGKLWALNRSVFRTVILRSIDSRKAIIKTLKNVEILKSLNTQQLQRLADLFVEESYPANHYIIKQGEIGDKFYLIVKGLCDCTIAKNEGEEVVMHLKDNDYFGEKALLTSAPRAANVISKTPTTVFYINKSAFEEILGPLSQIIDEDRVRRESLSAIDLKLNCPQKISDIAIIGGVSDDSTGPTFLGSFGNIEKKPNVTVRSYIISEVDRIGAFATIQNCIDIARQLSASSIDTHGLIAKLKGVCRDRNAFHFVFDVALVCDLDTIVSSSNMQAGVAEPTTGEIYRTQQQPLQQKALAYTAASLFLGLESLHKQGIAYRAVHPEGVFISAKGSIVLMDYRVSKLGLDGDAKTFTLCGVADYLAPEQISQQGHGLSVDLWSLGTLMYELAVGTHPFSAGSELETYSKISLFGSKYFSSLSFPDYVPNDVKAVINSLVVANPDARLGRQGFETLKKFALFSGVDWTNFESVTSPFESLAQVEFDRMLKDKLDSKVFKSFGDAFTSSSGWENHIDVN